MRKVKWGVMGTAMIFERNTAEGMRQAENCEMYAIAGRSPDKTEKFKEKYGFQKAYNSYEELIADPEVEAVYIPLPNTMHHDWTIRALRAKKHVLCEKPIATTAAEAQEMFNAAKENGVYLMEAFAYLHSPIISALAEDVQSGVIGDIRYMEAGFCTSDYNHSNIRMRKETCGGCTYDLGVYANSLVLRILGREPETVQAIAHKAPDGIDLYTTSIFEYADGAVANIECGMVLATDKHRGFASFQIHGTKGEISSDRFNFNAHGKLSYRLQTFDGIDEVRTIDVPHNYRLEVEQLGRCIIDGEKPAVSGTFSLANARIIDRILSAIGYGTPDHL